MKNENNISNRWELLENAIGTHGIKQKFNAYGWYEDSNLTISKDEHWSGWFNDNFDFVCIWPQTSIGKSILEKIKTLFLKNGYEIRRIINGGISIHYYTMTKEEIDKKAYDNLMHGGRMSD